MEGQAVKEWLTCRELAAEALPDLPRTESGLARFAARRRWDESMAYARDRAGLGGGIEYHVALLPTAARLEYERRHRQIEIVQAPLPPTVVLGADLSDRAAQERDARLAIVAAFEAFSNELRISLASRVQIFVDRYNRGSHYVPDWVRGIIPTLSKRTLARWRAVKGTGRADRLAVDRSAARKGKGIIETANDGKLRTFVLALIAHQPLITAAQVRTQCRAEFGDTVVDHAGRSVDMPPVRTFQHALKALKTTEKVVLTRLSDPDRYRSTMAPAGVGTYAWISTPNALWMIDASPVDALCVDGRWAIYACIDIATRRTIWYVARTPRAEAVAMLLRKAILEWGAPEKIKTDNGSDFKAISTQRLLAALGIEVEYSDPYSPQQKGHVERAIRTFQHDCASLLPGFVGHSVADRKRIEDRKGVAARLGQETADAFGVELTGPQLQGYVDRWSNEIYAHREHGGLDGATPALTAARSTAPIKTIPERALDILLMPAVGKDGIRVTTKFGVRVGDYHYIVHEALPGHRLMVRMDPMDAGRALAFDAETGRFVGEAICAELRGISAATLLAAKREITNERLAEASREVKAEIKRITKGPNLLERALGVAARDIPNVVALPKREEAHETPAIAAALEVGRTHEAAPLTPRAAEIFAAAKAEAPVIVEARGTNVRPLRTQETRQQRFRRALEVEDRIARGESVSNADAVWLGGYQQGSEYRSMRTLYEDGGEQVLR
jgi:transposase InsO family protein